MYTENKGASTTFTIALHTYDVFTSYVVLYAHSHTLSHAT